MRGTEEKEVRREEGGKEEGKLQRRDTKCEGIVRREQSWSGSDQIGPNRPSLRNISSLFTAACSGRPSARERGVSG